MGHELWWMLLPATLPLPLEVSLTRSQTATIHGERDDLSSLPLERNTREDAA